MTQEFNTTCPYCGVGCGVLVAPQKEDGWTVRGDPTHPANQGRLCSKGTALADTLDLDGRLLAPQLDGEEVDWDTALEAVSQGFGEAIRQHGPEAVAFYVSGQLLTEDYYVANKLMKGFIGSNNIDTNSRLCMSSPVAAHKRAFGTDTVPGCYEDLEQAGLIVLIGSNAAWCHPVLYQRIAAARKANPGLKVVVIDPRETATCQIADLHLAVAPGSDAFLFNGLLTWLEDQGLRESLFVEHCTEGLDETLRMARWSAPNIAAVAAHCALDPKAVELFYTWFSDIEHTVSLYSQGVNQSTSGTDKINAILNCHLLTGRIGRPGMGPFSLTGQPNAMGGREVGALANQLANHLELSDPVHRDTVARFWGVQGIQPEPGLKAVELMEAVESGRIRALWIMGTNPAVSMPDANRVRRALEHCPFLVVSDCMGNTDTAAYADCLLPAQTWGEKDGTVTNSERRISRQRAFLSPPGQSRPDWWIVAQVARRMGFADAFGYSGPAEIFAEHAALSGFENHGERDFDLSGLANLEPRQYDSLQPIQWPVNDHQRAGTPRLFSNGQFYTANRRARLVPVAPRPPAHLTGGNYPMVLNTGRVRDHWHTMTRTGKSARLSAHRAEPYLAIHPQDASRLGLDDGALVQVGSAWGDAILRLTVCDSQAPGQVFAPMHWSDQYAATGRVGALVNPDTDPLSGQPEFKHTPVRLTPYRAAWYGFLLTRRPIQCRNATYWARSRGKGLWRYEIAGEEAPEDWARYARKILCEDRNNVQWSEYFDPAEQTYRAARIVDGTLESCIFIGPDWQLPPRDWLTSLFAQPTLDASDRASLLSGQPANPAQDVGPIVCSCFSVGLNTLLDTIRNGQAASVEELGALTQAGTNCGSCRPELEALLGRG